MSVDSMNVIEHDWTPFRGMPLVPSRYRLDPCPTYLHLPHHTKSPAEVFDQETGNTAFTPPWQYTEAKQTCLGCLSVPVLRSTCPTSERNWGIRKLGYVPCL